MLSRLFSFMSANVMMLVIRMLVIMVIMMLFLDARPAYYGTSATCKISAHACRNIIKDQSTLSTQNNIWMIMANFTGGKPPCHIFMLVDQMSIERFLACMYVCNPWWNDMHAHG